MPSERTKMNTKGKVAGWVGVAALALGACTGGSSHPSSSHPASQGELRVVLLACPNPLTDTARKGIIRLTISPPHHTGKTIDVKYPFKILLKLRPGRYEFSPLGFSSKNVVVSASTVTDVVLNQGPCMAG